MALSAILGDHYWGHMVTIGQLALFLPMVIIILPHQGLSVQRVASK